jgi:GntR family transcriptional regulator
MAYEVEPPKYVQVITALQERIDAGVYPPGSKLPSENELADEFGHSRPTVVRALDILKRDGWVDKQQGRGTFVRGRPSVGGERTRLGGGALRRDETAGKLLDVGRVLATPRLADLLGVPEGSSVVRRRWLGMDGEPVELLTTYIGGDLASGTGLDASAPLSGGVRQVLETRARVKVDHISERISARTPDADEAKVLVISRREPVLIVSAVAHAADGRPLVLVDAVLPGDRHELEDVYPAD